MLQFLFQLGIVISLILTTEYNAFALINCPESPKQNDKDSQVVVNTEIGKLGPVKGADLKTEIRRKTQDLLSKLPNADKLYLKQMMYSAYCTALRDDKTLSDREKAKLLREYNNEIRKAFTEKKQDSGVRPPAPKSKVPRPLPRKEVPSNDSHSSLDNERIQRAFNSTIDQEKALTFGQDGVELWETFLTRYPDYRAADEKLAMWQKRKGAILCSGEWVSGERSLKVIADNLKQDNLSSAFECAHVLYKLVIEDDLDDIFTVYINSRLNRENNRIKKIQLLYMFSEEFPGRKIFRHLLQENIKDNLKETILPDGKIDAFEVEDYLGKIHTVKITTSS